MVAPGAFRNDQRDEPSRSLHDALHAAGPSPEGPVTRSIVELDMLVEDNRPLLVPYDVIAVQAIAVLIEIVLALRAREFFQRKNGLAYLRGFGRGRLVDRGRQDRDGIEGPGALNIGCRLV